MLFLIRHIEHAKTLVRSPIRCYVKPWRQVRNPPFLTAHSTGVDCIFTLVLPCETFTKSSDNQLNLAYPTLLRYNRALCLERRDDLIWQISQASNLKKPTRFTVTSWIVWSEKGHNSAIQSVCLFCNKTFTSATLCQDMFGNMTTSSLKLWQLTSVLPIMSEEKNVFFLYVCYWQNKSAPFTHLTTCLNGWRQLFP